MVAGGVSKAVADPLTYRVIGDTVAITACDVDAKGDLEIPSIYEGKPVTKIWYYAFSHCSGLTSVTIPGSVTIVDDYAFVGCSGLTSMPIPDGVTRIGKEIGRASGRARV